MNVSQFSIHTKSHSKILLVATLLTTVLGCSAEKSAEPTEDATAPYSVHLAFAGGGWRAHTGHSAWTISLLGNGSKKLSDVFKHVGTLSSNSGGSWFSTMLTYSPKFVKSIEARNAIHSWSASSKTATGWLGQQQYLFDNAGCNNHSGDTFLACVFDTYTGSITNATYWKKVVDDLVFHNSDIRGPLSGTRQPWAAKKPLLLAATLLTNETVLGSNFFGDKQYYQACLSTLTPILNGDKGASCGKPPHNTPTPTPEVTPVTFSSMPSGTNFTAPKFFPAVGTGQSGSQINLGYTSNASSPTKKTTSVNNPIPNDHIPIKTAAAASSAAAGFAASKPLTGDWEEAYLASDEALNFQLDGSLQYLIANGMTVDQLAKAKFVQIADGGPADNSGVAQLVSFLQLNGEGDNFNIVAFDNVETLFSPGGNGAKIGTDLAYLFGQGLAKGDKFCTEPNGKGYCVTVPKLKIFDDAALVGTPATWEIATNANNPPTVVQELVYTKYSVTTVDNPIFGITKGKKGTLHAFTAAWSTADTAPQNNVTDADFKAYKNMLEFINIGLHSKDKNGVTGIGYLEAALEI